MKHIVIRKADGKLSCRGYGGMVKESNVVREGETVLGEAIVSVGPNDTPFLIEVEPGKWTIDEAAKLEWKDKKQDEKDKEMARIKAIFKGVRDIPDTISSIEEADVAIQYLKRAILEIRKG